MSVARTGKEKPGHASANSVSTISLHRVLRGFLLVLKRKKAGAQVHFFITETKLFSDIISMRMNGSHAYF
jgi:hypothetical protein